MKIRINKDIVEITPEHAAEAAELEALWIKMGNCVGGNKRLEQDCQLPHRRPDRGRGQRRSGNPRSL